MTDWLSSSTHHAWLADHVTHLLAFGRRTAVPGGGAAWLDDCGAPDPTQPLQTWITARMTHVYGLGSLLGIPGCTTVAEAAMAGLVGPLHDDAHGGWHPARGDGGAEAGKTCYDHAFVLLAASTAVQAELPGADDLLGEAGSIFLEYFWDATAGRCLDGWDTAFERSEPYRGINGNMHAVEAMLSVAGVTGEVAWLHRAGQVVDFVIAQAAANGWRIPEHYGADWVPDFGFNQDNPADRFKPFGATVGHAFEWARLIVHLANAPIDVDRVGLTAAAERLFAQAVLDGWRRDGNDGFVYTTDWQGNPVVRDRLHWVVAEAISAAAALHAQTGKGEYASSYQRWWDYTAAYFVDAELGSWRHQLDPENRPSATVWKGKPDLYHVVQLALAPTLPLYPMLATALRDRSRASAAV